MKTTRRYAILLFALLLNLQVAMSQDNGKKKFSPEKFEAELEAYITQEAEFTQQESARFFTLFREMHQKQRTLYGRITHHNKQHYDDEAAAENALRECDKLNIELKQTEKKYHERMLSELPATKVFKAIKAEGRFHRRMMKGWQKPKRKDK